MSEQDIRWKQRAQNFEQAFLRLKEAMEMEELNELEKDGVCYQFKITMDLAWSLLKDALIKQGFSFSPSPNTTFRLAQQSKWIDNAQLFIDGAELRNSISMDYDGRIFFKNRDKIKLEWLPALEQLHNVLKTRLRT
jgi:nucleotidyltransferase substrate binding protein (TIGR01987 family)